MTGRVSRVIDGDTLEIDSDDGSTDRIRLVLVDAPESYETGGPGGDRVPHGTVLERARPVRRGRLPGRRGPVRPGARGRVLRRGERERRVDRLGARDDVRAVLLRERVRAGGVDRMSVGSEHQGNGES